MASTAFIPYWRQIGPPSNPYSFVFFVVAQTAGCRRPLAVVSSRAIGTMPGDESIQGTPLITACQRVITIFSDSANRSAIRAELSLAEGYYLRDGGQELHQSELAELPEHLHGYNQSRIEWASENPEQLQPFPIISACLLQGVAFDTKGGQFYAASLEPLDTVYRDTNVEWGMVTFDITNLLEVRYGIVGFAAAPMKWIDSREALYRHLGNPDSHVPPITSGGQFRVVEQVQPRIAMSATEYLSTFAGPGLALGPGDSQITNDDTAIMTELLAAVPLVEPGAFEIIWPVDSVDSDDDTALTMEGLSLGMKRTLHEQAIRSLLQSATDVQDFDIAIFDDVRELAYFPEMLRQNLLKDFTRFWNTRSAGLLLRLAFQDGEHLNLGKVQNLSVTAILSALNAPGLVKISSLCLCTTNIRDLSSELIEGLFQSDSFREIYFMQSPSRRVDTPDAPLVEALSSRTQFLTRVKVVFAGSYSAALRKTFWLPASTDKARNPPLSIFPIQQILTRAQTNKGNLNGTKIFAFNSVYLGDSLLGPERFVAGFLAYLRTSFTCFSYINPSARLFTFSTAPSSLSVSSLASAEISPIPTESFALDADFLPDDIRPKVRDLDPDGWTVLVSFEHHWDRELEHAAFEWSFARVQDRTAQEPPRPRADYIRYAFVRARRQTIKIASTPSKSLGPDELEVMDVKNFLAIMAPEVDPELVDVHLGELAEQLIHAPGQGILPSGVEPLSVLGREEAVDMLFGCFIDAEDLNKRLRNAMKEDLEGRKWYPELL